MRDDGVALGADAAAAWHAAWLDALGIESARDDRVWRALAPPPVIYWTVITLSPEAGPDDLRQCGGTVCDAWSAIDLAPSGFTVRAEEPWFLRPPGPLADDAGPDGLEIVRASSPAEVEEFELASVRGFGGENASVEAGAIHPAEVLSDPHLTMLTGRVDGSAVAAATSYRTPRAVGIYGVATLPSARGRGYASALTRALIDPARPATLSPSPEAESLYRRLGFAPVGALRMWQRR